MSPLFWHELRLNRRVLLALVVAVGLFSFGMALVAPSIQETLSQTLKLVPSFLRPMVGERLQVQGLAGVFSVIYTHPVWMTLVGAWAVGYGSRAIAADIEHGTLGLTLAYPLTRSQLVAAKALTLATGLLALALVTVLATAAGLAFQQEALPAGMLGYAWAVVGMSLLFGSIGAFALACSAVASEGGKALGGALAFTLTSYALDALGRLWKTADPYRAGSIFKYYDPKTLLEGTPPEPLAWAYLGGVTLASLIVAWVAFNRRDLSI
jgi:ABC-type transport system involved in multi-copper enzyme maturation permease subunit